MQSCYLVGAILNLHNTPGMQIYSPILTTSLPPPTVQVAQSEGKLLPTPICPFRSAPAILLAQNWGNQRRRSRIKYQRMRVLLVTTPSLPFSASCLSHSSLLSSPPFASTGKLEGLSASMCMQLPARCSCYICHS